MISPFQFVPRQWKSTVTAVKIALCKRTGKSLPVTMVFIALSQLTPVSAESVAVRYVEGLSRGFLVVGTQDGRPIAEGDLSQVVHGDRVTSRMTFRFKDGSVEDETTIFSERGTFHLLSDRVLQRGPAFKQPMETSIEATSGRVIVRYTGDGKEKVLTDKLDLPSDLSNGLLLTLLKNIQPNTSRTTVSYLATTPKPRLVHLVITPEAQEAFSTGISKHKAIDYDVKVEIGGVAGLIAHVLGKQPADTNVWVLLGDAPTFVGLEGPFFAGGPIWRVDLASPVRQGP